ncbi:ABC transporter substrate-binding protein [Cupriavidus gilardii]|uniref:ABC transporter substrate-binding protein n=1 Tax=Cupriavidus gilardii TaxID=82541 RepID=A0A6N1BVZ1_9BURK|nr:ABC transporter substrate-binding protein [Cupriavidus gilardii]ALD92186.1 branched-chain amino acid transport system substrate-binding protein [Cupriavidus gilardii CR3]QQE09089.1 ABC transporter substrate-binding protein [Cupriavidus sp. ISTL7]KAB0596907.1 ABC transporter substrate-binding protein [Cupriavidus gilardii]MCT9014880.1 ABC transporter substrate-binding protein [Cupriavidus gilardii]MCT9053292.1 ABC transporter substrate-binding protein [Cupriavidus gilardii]
MHNRIRPQRRLRRAAAAVAVTVSALLGSAAALAQNTIKIGEINSYKAQPAFLEPYKRGWEMAIEEVNAAGGVLGKKLEVVSRDDNGNPGDSVRVAEELVARERVALLFGGFLSNTGLALTDYARQRRVFFLAAEPLTDKIVWQNGNRYTYRLRPSTYMQVAMLVPEAARLKKKRWAIVYPNYEYGQSAVATFKKLLKQAQPDVEFVAEQAPPLGKVDAGSVVQALADAKPDAIFNVLFAADLGKFVREGNTRGLFEGREVVSLLTGEPEYLDPLRGEAPKNWIVTGYPWYAIDTPENKKFVEAYRKKFNDTPRVGSVVGYAAVKSIAAGLQKAGSADSDKLAAAFSGLRVDTPMGQIVYRPQDHQSTMGAYVGRTGVRDGKGVMTSFVYVDGAKVQPSDAEVKAMRPAQ